MSCEADAVPECFPCATWRLYFITARDMDRLHAYLRATQVLRSSIREFLASEALFYLVRLRLCLNFHMALA